MQRLLIDTDTASDDAIAILMALRTPGVRVEALTIVAGNVPVELGAQNALNTVELCGAQIPVYVGLPRPLLREPRWSYGFHGKNGMGGLHLPPSRQEPQGRHAVEAIIDIIRAAPGQITLVALGPLTNIAVAVSLAPDIAHLLRAAYVMGGTANAVGNVTPAAEYNIWCDPEAARIVFHSGMPICMVGLELSHRPAALTEEELAHIRRFDTPYADFALDCSRAAIEAHRRLGMPGLTLPDPLTVAIAMDPTICTRCSRHYVDVETSSELTRGMTVVDQWGVLQREPNLDVCWSVDAPRWKEALYGTLRSHRAEREA
ncbi:MAG: nucleoside hydrolase [Chloroflexi bacterium]|nr:nucleoside hydrolase [Chloroflexota bacterium]